MNKLLTSVYALAATVITTPVFAAVDCATLPSCSDLGYTDTAANCPSGKVLCPFDTTKAKCVDPMVGEIKLWPSATIPKGWKICDGSTLPSATYGALYNVIKTSFGGNATNFALPNFKGRVPVGVGYATTSSYTYYMGSTGGEEKHTLTISEMPSHDHAIYGKSSSGKFGDDANHRPVIDNSSSATKKAWTDWGASPYTQKSGSGYAHENRMPYLAVNYIIFTGVY